MQTGVIDDMISKDKSHMRIFLSFLTVNTEHIASTGIYINAVSVWIVFCKYRSHRIKSPYRSINHLLKKLEAFYSVHHVVFILCYTVL